MNLYQLKILLTIVETGSFSGAAKNLSQTQPGISIAIKKLETELGVSLFSRNQYRAKLTPEGNAIYQKAKRIIQQSDELLNLGKQLSSGIEPEIWIAIDSLFPTSIITNLLKHYIDTYSETRFNLTVEYIEGAKDRLINSDANLAVFSKDQIIAGLESKPLMTVSLIPVATPDFPAAKLNRELNDDELKQYIQVIVGDSSRSVRQETNPNYPTGAVGLFKDGKHWIVNDNTIKKQIIKAGLGWGRLPEYLIHKELASRTLVPLNSKTIKPVQSEMHIVRRSDRSAGLIAEHIWNEISLVSRGYYNN
ncbi:LysR family transcriptional regulator [bacterium]|nr:LysR family transcriptional regulator [bacterium]